MNISLPLILQEWVAVRLVSLISVNVLKTDNKIVVICGCNGTLVRLLESIGVKTYVINYRSRRMLIRNIFKIRHIILTEQIKIIHNNDPLTSVLFYFANNRNQKN